MASQMTEENNVSKSSLLKLHKEHLSVNGWSSTAEEAKIFQILGGADKILPMLLSSNAKIHQNELNAIHALLIKAFPKNYKFEEAENQLSLTKETPNQSLSDNDGAEISVIYHESKHDKADNDEDSVYPTYIYANRISQHLSDSDDEDSDDGGGGGGSVVCNDSEDSNPEIIDILDESIIINCRKEELLVNGYTRQLHSSLVPGSVIQLICLWYNSKDWWDPNYIHRRLTVSLDCIERENQVNGVMYNAFGSMTISKGYKKVWKLKILTYRDKIFAQIGIVDSRLIEFVGDDILRRDIFTGDVSSLYGLRTIGCCGHDGDVYDNGISKEYGPNWKKYDVITMILDMDVVDINGSACGCLRYIINDDEQKIAVNDLDLNVSYKLALGLMTTEEIKLIQ